MQGTNMGIVFSHLVAIPNFIRPGNVEEPMPWT